jgi:hypothetical protein
MPRRRGNHAMLARLIPIVLASPLALAEDGVPTVDIQKTCRAAASVTSGTSTQMDIDVCVSSEQRAREQIVKDWAQFPPADKARCVQAGRNTYLPSYVEWLTCLEMEMAVRKMRNEERMGQTPRQR